MKYKERYKEIADMVQKKKRVLVSELSKKFNVSEVTIRKDLNELEEIGVCRRFHSGAVAAEAGVFDVPVKHKVTVARHLKQRIAREAVQMVTNNITVMIDAGSTAHSIAYYLKGRKNIRVVTNSLMVGTELADDKGIELILTGGNVRPVSQALVGSVALETMSKIHVDIAFVGTMGISEERGFTSSTIAEAQGKEAMLSAARQKVIVADHTKLEKISFVTFAGINDVDLLITDDEADPKIIKNLRKTGLEIILAQE